MRDLLGGYYTTNSGNKNIDLNMLLYVGDKLGYGISYPSLKATLNACYTIWANKSSSYNGPDPVGNNGNILYPLRNVNARHMGIELRVAREITRSLQLNAAILLSDWRWVGNGRYTVTDANNNVPAGFEDNPTYLDGVHVGDAAQNQFQIGLRYEPFKRFYIRLSFLLFTKYYAAFNLNTLISESSCTDSYRVSISRNSDLHFGYDLPPWSQPSAPRPEKLHPERV